MNKQSLLFHQKLKPDILRHEMPSADQLKRIKHNPIYFVLDNIIDTYNIGSLFRLADAIGATKIFICGESEYPPSSRIHKAAVGTENWVKWEKFETANEALKSLRQEEKQIQIVAVEQNKRSIKIKNLNDHVKFPVAIVVGNETNGVSKKVLDMADLIVELPMYGINTSFNVWGSAAVVAYKITELLQG